METLNKTNSLFTIFKDKDEVLLEEIYTLCKREQKEDKGKVWIRNKLFFLKKRGIAEPIYGFGTLQNGRTSYHCLIGIKLTEDGKNLLGRGTKELQQSRTGEVVESQADAKPIRDPDTMYLFEQLEQLIERFPNRKVSLEYDVRRNNKQDPTLENPRIVIYPVAQ